MKINPSWLRDIRYAYKPCSTSENGAGRGSAAARARLEPRKTALIIHLMRLISSQKKLGGRDVCLTFSVYFCSTGSLLALETIKTKHHDFQQKSEPPPQNIHILRCIESGPPSQALSSLVSNFSSRREE